MSEPRLLEAYFENLQRSDVYGWQGRVTQVMGELVESDGPLCSAGDACEVLGASGKMHAGVVVGFHGAKVVSMMLEPTTGIRLADRVVAKGGSPAMPVSAAMLGRVIDATGEPLDSKGSWVPERWMPVVSAAPLPLERVPIREALGCGVRALDGMVTCGRGQRLGIFGGSGVGKSTLLGMMLRGTSAEITVLALVGERGREVGEFLEIIGAEGLRRSVVVVSTSDQSPLLRLRAALSATAIAEYFASAGKHVLLVVDSLTRFAMAQREIGLAAGEPPTAKGYTPSVLNLLAGLVERAGCFKTGSITAYYTVLMEGDDQQDPVVDTVRSLLDGHIVLDRDLAARGHYPPINVLDSLSRLMPSIGSPAHLEKASDLRRLLSAYVRSEDLIRIGAYQKGSDPLLDRAIEAMPKTRAFLMQRPQETVTFPAVLKSLLEIPI